MLLKPTSPPPLVLMPCTPWLVLLKPPAPTLLVLEPTTPKPSVLTPCTPVPVLLVLLPTTPPPPPMPRTPTPLALKPDVPVLLVLEPPTPVLLVLEPTTPKPLGLAPVTPLLLALAWPRMPSPPTGVWTVNTGSVRGLFAARARTVPVPARLFVSMLLVRPMRMGSLSAICEASFLWTVLLAGLSPAYERDDATIARQAASSASNHAAMNRR